MTTTIRLESDQEPARPAQRHIRASTCRFCSAYCPGDVTTEGDTVVAVEGNRRTRYPDGKIFHAAHVRVAEKDPACSALLQLADAEMIAELAEVRGEDIAQRRGTDADFPVLMIPRRIQNATNGSFRPDPPWRAKSQTRRSSIRPTWRR